MVRYVQCYEINGGARYVWYYEINRVVKNLYQTPPECLFAGISVR